MKFDLFCALVESVTHHFDHKTLFPLRSNGVRVVREWGALHTGSSVLFREEEEERRAGSWGHFLPFFNFCHLSFLVRSDFVSVCLSTYQPINLSTNTFRTYPFPTYSLARFFPMCTVCFRKHIHSLCTNPFINHSNINTNNQTHNSNDKNTVTIKWSEI